MSEQEKHPQSTQRKARICSPAHEQKPKTHQTLSITHPHQGETHRFADSIWDFNSGATEAQVGLASYYKFILKKALGAAFICTILPKKFYFREATGVPYTNGCTQLVKP